MVFSSLLFTFFFLPVVLLLFYLTKEKYRNYILLPASIFFYAYGEPKFVFVLLASVLINYALARGIAAFKKGQEEQTDLRAKGLLVLAVVVNIGLLFVFKYLDFTLTTIGRVLHVTIPVFGIALPIGISFFTFQALSYVIDVYRGTVEVQKNPFYVALYISFFPQLIAGPIVRYSTIEKQLAGRTYTLDGFAEGARRFFLGFCKKVLLANNLAVVATEIFGKEVASTPASVLWLGSVCYSLQILYDFSGYSDMAIGLGKLFGFRFLENFDYPYISRTVTEFWRRWHISLGQWFRDYVYVPLGGSHVPVARHVCNLFLVWLLTGIWHGASLTFVAWGLGYFLLLLIEKYIVRPEQRNNRVLSAFWRICTLLAVNFGWVLFNSPSIRSGIRYCLGMLGKAGGGMILSPELIRYFREFGFFLAAGLIFSTPFARWAGGKLRETRFAAAADVLIPVGYGLLFLWAVSYIILGSHNPFIYFNF